MKMGSTKRRLVSEINVVPYIDVMLVLLVIFMITAPLLSQGVNVDLPQAGAKTLAQEREPIIVSIDAKGQYFLNIAATTTQPISHDQLLAQVKQKLMLGKQQHQERNVFVKADKHVDYGQVVQAMVLLQQAGAASVGLMTDDSATRGKRPSSVFSRHASESWHP